MKLPPQFCDTHCHINHSSVELSAEAQVHNAAAAGVRTMVTIGVRDSEFASQLAICEQFPNVACTYGIHPHDAGQEFTNLDDLAAAIKQNTQHACVVGIGETGLDYYYDHAPRVVQQESFRTHLRCARELDLPVVIHSRNAEDDTMAILTEALDEGPLTLILHCFSSNKALASFAVERGIYLGMGGIVTFPKSTEFREIFKAAPDELILLETDAPFLAPVPLRGKVNQPAYMVHTAEVLADLKGKTLDEIATITWQNSLNAYPKLGAYLEGR